MSTTTRINFEKEAKRLRPLLLRVATSIIGTAQAEDIVQETLLKLWFIRDRLDSYSSIDAIARVIVRNLSINALKQNRIRPLDFSSIPEISDEDSHEAELPDELLALISTLPDTEQAVLRMKHLEGMETEEIAALIDSTPGAVRTALSRARCRIRKHYLANS